MSLMRSLTGKEEDGDGAQVEVDMEEDLVLRELFFEMDNFCMLVAANLNRKIVSTTINVFFYESLEIDFVPQKYTFLIS